jgi:hypothetical protein
MGFDAERGVEVAQKVIAWRKAPASEGGRYTRRRGADLRIGHYTGLEGVFVAD